MWIPFAIFALIAFLLSWHAFVLSAQFEAMRLEVRKHGEIAADRPLGWILTFVTAGAILFWVIAMGLLLCVSFNVPW